VAIYLRYSAFRRINRLPSREERREGEERLHKRGEATDQPKNAPYIPVPCVITAGTKGRGSSWWSDVLANHGQTLRTDSHDTKDRWRSRWTPHRADSWVLSESFCLLQPCGETKINDD